MWHPNEEKPPNSSSSVRDVVKNATLMASSETISQGDMVVVSWSGYLPIPQRSWIGVYCPHTAQSSDYLDYIWLNNTSITGSVRLGPIVNMRCLFEFRLFDENEEVVAISNLVQFEKGEMAPLQGRLSLVRMFMHTCEISNYLFFFQTHNTDEMRVMWVSNTDGRAVVQVCSDDECLPATHIHDFSMVRLMMTCLPRRPLLERLTRTRPAICAGLRQR